RLPSDFGRGVRRNAAEPFEFRQGTTTKSNHAMARLDQIAAHRQGDLSNAHKTDRCHFANLSDDSVLLREPLLHHFVRRSRSPQICVLRSFWPWLRPLWIAPMPGPRSKVAEPLGLHLVEL